MWALVLPNKAVETPQKGGRQRRRPKRRQLFCPAHQDELLYGNGKKYFLHLLSPDELVHRGIKATRAKLIIQSYPVLVLNNEWLEELYCNECGISHWCHIIRHDKVAHTVRWAPRDLWQQVAHVDVLCGNPTVSQFSSREARRHRRQKTKKGKMLFDLG
jgi:hypothetical protein